VQDSAFCKDKSSADKGSDANPLTGPDGILYKVSVVVALLAGTIAVVMIIAGAGQMISSGGDANKVKEARTKITHSLIGLVIIALAQTIVTIMIKVVIN
jgi:hypothetical protein